jgi:hypothetical protein
MAIASCCTARDGINRLNSGNTLLGSMRSVRDFHKGHLSPRFHSQKT